MNIKAEVCRQIAAKLENELWQIKRGILERKWEMKKLVEKQTIEKRKLAELQKLANSFVKKSNDFKEK